MIRYGVAMALSALLAGPAFASSEGEKKAASSDSSVALGCPMTYSDFELAIPHVDVNCPEGLSMGSATFCRASVANDAIHVYVFRNDDLQCLLDMKTFDDGAFTLTTH